MGACCVVAAIVAVIVAAFVIAATVGCTMVPLYTIYAQSGAEEGVRKKSVTWGVRCLGALARCPLSFILD